MDKCREEFQKAFPIPAHWIEFDEKANRYYCPYVADATASTYQSKWVVWQHQQAKVERAQTNAELLNEALQRSVAREEELQKRVDQQGLIIAKAMSIASDLQKSWSMFKIGKKLEQAFKGGGQ